jgi:hypothetical protein
MTVDLDKKALVSLVKGTEPYYSAFDNPLVKRCGKWIAGFVDSWSWSGTSLYDLTEEELYELYKICEKSWENEIY